MDVVVHVCDPSTWEAEAGKWRVQSQPEGQKGRRGAEIGGEGASLGEASVCAKVLRWDKRKQGKIGEK